MNIAMKNSEMQNPGRRKFLRVVPAAAAALTLADAALLPSFAQAQSEKPFTEGDYKVFSAEELTGGIPTAPAKPVDTVLFNDKNFVFELATEKATPPGDFGWHEDHDHIVHILDGTTIYELGGTPQNGHTSGHGQWRAPSATGATRVTLKKGDVLVIRRNTLHRRITPETVALTITSPATS